MDLKDKTLNEAAKLFSKGAISRQQAVNYCIEWNNTAVRFTQAIVLDNSIINLEPELLWPVYPQQCEECKVKLI